MFDSFRTKKTAVMVYLLTATVVGFGFKGIVFAASDNTDQVAITNDGVSSKLANWKIVTNSMYKAPYTSNTAIDTLVEDNSKLATKVQTLELLTAPGQYWIDQASHVVYYWSTDGADPNTHDIVVTSKIPSNSDTGIAVTATTSAQATETPSPSPSALVTDVTNGTNSTASAIAQPEIAPTFSLTTVKSQVVQAIKQVTDQTSPDEPAESIPVGKNILNDLPSPTPPSHSTSQPSGSVVPQSNSAPTASAPETNPSAAATLWQKLGNFFGHLLGRS